LSVISDLQAKRKEARNAADEILTRASDEQRDLSPDELSTNSPNTASTLKKSEKPAKK
jgi:hypothetical protein